MRLIRGALVCAVILCIPFSIIAGDFAVIAARWVDVYSDAAEQDEQRVAQALYGEPVIIEAAQRGWSRIRLLYHVQYLNGEWQNTRGWVRNALLSKPGDTTLEQYRNNRIIATGSATRDYVSVQILEAGEYVFFDSVPAGTIFHSTGRDGSYYKVLLASGNTGYISAGDASPFNPESPSHPTERIASFAERFIKKPFIRAGISPAGTDAPGLIYIAARMSGRLMPSDLAAQKRICAPLTQAHARRGDLVFIHATHPDLPTGGGIYLGNNEYITTGTHAVEILPLPVQGLSFGRPGSPAALQPVTESRAQETGFYSSHIMSLREIDNAAASLQQEHKASGEALFLTFTKAEGQQFHALHRGFYAPSGLRPSDAANIRLVPTRNALLGRSFFSVQVMALRNARLAISEGDKLHTQGYPVWIKYEQDEQKRNWSSVLLGYFPTLAEARAYASSLELKTGAVPFIRQFSFYSSP